jgi:transcription elongation factor GreA
MADDKKDTSTSDDNKVTFVTKEGLKKLKQELAELENVKRKEIAARLKEAIAYGDLNENSEYHDAKTEQAFVEGRIAELKKMIKYAKIIEGKHHLATVQLGTKVVIKQVNKKNAEPEEYIIVGATEADPLESKISNESPIGSALLEKQKGDIVKAYVPEGVVEYEIMQLE